MPYASVASGLQVVVMSYTELVCIVALDHYNSHSLFVDAKSECPNNEPCSLAVSYIKLATQKHLQAVCMILAEPRDSSGCERPDPIVGRREEQTGLL